MTPKSILQDLKFEKLKKSKKFNAYLEAVALHKTSRFIDSINSLADQLEEDSKELEKELYRLWIENLAHLSDSKSMNELLKHFDQKIIQAKEDLEDFLGLKGLLLLEIGYLDHANLLKKCLDKSKSSYAIEFNIRFKTLTSGSFAHYELFQPSSDYFQLLFLADLHFATGNNKECSHINSVLKRYYKCEYLENLNPSHLESWYFFETNPTDYWKLLNTKTNEIREVTKSLYHPMNMGDVVCLGRRVRNTMKVKAIYEVSSPMIFDLNQKHTYGLSLIHLFKYNVQIESELKSIHPHIQKLTKKQIQDFTNSLRDMNTNANAKEEAVVFEEFKKEKQA
jgi:hypothetical protein